MKKIVVADDEEALRFLIVETLEINEYEIFQASSGKEALQTIKKVNPDLVLLDAMMPEMTGYEVAKDLMACKEKPIIIMLTAKTQHKDRLEALNNGVDHFLTKPFSPIELLTTVEEILGE